MLLAKRVATQLRNSAAFTRCPRPAAQGAPGLARGALLRCTATKTRVEHVCSDCGHSDVRWFGRCPSCQAFNTCAQINVSPASSSKRAEADPVKHIARQKGWLQGTSTVTNVAELRRRGLGRSSVLQLPGDLGGEIGRVLGGGVRAGSLILIGGGPGLGKSTLLLQLAGLLACSPRWDAQPGSPLEQSGSKVLYISGEESEDQVVDRAERLGVEDGGNLDLLCESDMDVVLDMLVQYRPKAAILDSIQTMSLSSATGANGSVSQVRECAKSLVLMCKQALGIPIFVVGHITKGGDLAGPKSLEHIVDTTLYLEGEEGSNCRLVRAVKNRFGSTDETALLEMTSKGLRPVLDAAAFLEQQSRGKPRSRAASCTTVVMQGNRPVLVEIQALTNAAARDNPPKRMATGGIDYRRFDQVLAVLAKHGKIRLWDQDARVNVLGGVPSLEPAVDAALAAAVICSFQEVLMPAGTVVVGELDLGGDLRMVKAMEKRVASAVQLGFQTIVAPVGTKKAVAQPVRKHVVECQGVKELMRLFRDEAPGS